jgi:HEAT repeat protein
MAVRNIERELDQLASLRNQPLEKQADELARALRDKINVVVARAAKLIAEWELRALIPDLCTAFERLLTDPAKRDPQCWGKNAIAKALKDLGHSESETFLKGAQHVQMEPVWGGQEDTAATLRGTCALALLQCTDLTREDKLWTVMRLLSESSPSLRKDGALALESIGGREAALLLRLKARMSDRDSTVTGQVFESLLRVEGSGAVPFVLEFVRSPQDEVREEAVLALGVSRLSDAITVLQQLLAAPDSSVSDEILCRALSISRHEDALNSLIQVLQRGRPRQAIAALQALELHKSSHEIQDRIRKAVAHRSEGDIHQELSRLFPEET